MPNILHWLSLVLGINSQLLTMASVTSWVWPVSSPLCSQTIFEQARLLPASEALAVPLPGMLSLRLLILALQV